MQAIQPVVLDGESTAPSPLERRIAIGAPVVLVATMYPVFHLADRAAGGAGGGYLGWWIGLAVYWLVWGVGFPVAMLGWPAVAHLVRPAWPTRPVGVLIAFPLVLAAAMRFMIPGMDYTKPGWLAVVLLYTSALGNGLCEEMLWRGVYLRLFPHRRTWRVVWPSIWFGLWHLVPGSVSADSGLVSSIAMVAGPMMFGLYLAFLARRTGSVWWPAVAHVLGGLIMLS